MAITAPTQANVRSVADEAVAAGQPVSSEIGQALARGVNHLFESVHDVACNGKASKTVTGHAHTGAGDGHSIPRVVYSQVYGVPLGADPAVPSPVQYDYGEEESEAAQWVSLALLSNAHDTKGWLQVTAASGASATNPNMIVACPLHLRAGCKGVRVLMWRGVEIGSPPHSATEIEWLLELRPLITGSAASGTVLDRAAYTATANENAQFVYMPGTAPDASTVDGVQSGGNWLACTSPAGDRLAADGDFILYVGFNTDSVSSSGGSSVLLYSVTVYEVQAE